MKIYNIVNIPRGLSEEFVCDCQEEYNSGYTAGEENGFGKGYDSGFTDGVESVDCTDFYNSGVTDGFNSGYTSGTTDGYGSGVTAGEEIQKSKLTTLTVLENGVYSREDGYNEVNVQVPAASGAGYDSGFTDGYDSGYTDGSEDGYESGFTGGYDSGVTDGKEAQKSKLSFMTFTENGYYRRPDGWSAITVNVPTGVTINNQNKRVEISGGTFETLDIEYEGHKGYYWADTFITPDEGYTGLGTVSALTTFWADDAISYGEELQKKNLRSVTISRNGTYTRETGWSAVTVNVQTTPSQSGKTVNVDESDLTWNNGEYSLDLEITPDAGYSAMTQAEVDMHFIPTSAITYGYDSGYTAGYDSGFTDGYNSAATDNPGYDEGFEAGRLSGITEQKSKLGSYFINTNGTFTREDGWSSVTVDIDTSAVYQEGYNSGYTDGERDGFDNGYNSGYQTGLTEGYDSGHTDGYQEGYDSGYTDGQASVDCTDYYNNGYTDGYNSGYDSGFTDGAASVDCADFYNSGVTDGENNQKVKLSSTTITQNGTYTRADGWSAVTVNVAQTGYTQQDLDNAYASGWSGGYDSGYTDGQEDCSGSTAATAMTVSVPQGMIPGETGNTTVSTRPANVPTNLNYSSSDANVATIDNNGVITTVNSGTTNICVVDSISQLTSCAQLSVSAPYTGNADVTAIINARNAGDTVQLCSTSNMGSVSRMAIDGVEITPVSAYTFTDTNDHTLEVWYLSSSIPYDAFEYTARIKDVIINDRMTVIGGRAFFNCSGLTSVVIGSGITTINNAAFKECALTGVVIPNSVTSLGTNVFEKCSGLTSISFGTGITVIPSACVMDCTQLRTATINGPIFEIEDMAFKGCALTGFNFINTLMTIGDGAFADCGSLTRVVLPDTITSVGKNAFQSCLNLSSVTLSSGMTQISDYTFDRCTSLTGIVIPDSVTGIGAYAFSNCEEMTAVTLSSSLTVIGDQAFSYCAYLRGIDIPASCENIGAYAFRFSRGLAIYGITVRNPIPCTIGNLAFGGTDDATIYVPAGSVETYKTSTANNKNWATYASRIQAIP